MLDESQPTNEPSNSLLPPTPTPEPEPPKPESGGLRAKVPRQVATVVDRAFEVADEVADELKKVIDRVK